MPLTFYNVSKNNYWKKQVDKLDIKGPIHFIETNEKNEKEWSQVLIEVLAANKSGIPFVIIDLKSTKEHINYVKDTCRKLKLYRNVCSIFFTSGSTGKPKPIQCTNKAFLNCEKIEAEVYGLTRNDIIASIYPLNFKRGLLFFILAYYLNAPFVFIDKSDSYKSIIKQVIKKKVSFLSANPYQWGHLCKILEEENINLKITAHFASSSINKKTFDIMQKRTNKIVVNYGATEFGVTSFVHYPKNELRNKTAKALNCVGRSYSRDCKIKVLRKDGKECKFFEEGEIVVSGKNISPSCDHIFYTGDIGYKDKDGDLYLVGRKDDQIKIKGQRTNCSQFEKIYDKYNVYVFSVLADTLGWSEIVCIFETNEPLENIKEYVNSIQPPINSYYRPKYIFTIKTFPLTVTGKIDKLKIKEIFLKRINEFKTKSIERQKKIHNLNINKSASKSDIEASLIKIWQKLLGEKDIGIYDNFFDIGGNSLNIIELHNYLDKEFPGKISLSDLFVATCISKLVKIINKK